MRGVLRNGIAGTTILIVVCGLAARVDAQVTRIAIKSRAPFANGQAFGTAGPYEEIIGLAEGEIDPRDPRNALITDIELAPRQANGKVAYRTTFTIRRPVDMTKASGVLFYNIVNRGGRNGPSTWHYGGDPGDGFMYKLGQVMLWSGWQGDMPIATVSPGQEGIDVPVARHPDGSPVTGRVVQRFVNVAGNQSTQSLPGAGRMPATLDTASATLISAASETPAGLKGGVREIPSKDFAFADCRTAPFPGTPDPARICLKGGFDPALLYELVYTAKDPYVLGVGMAAMRDVVSFFRYAEKDAAGTVNPIFGHAAHVVAMGNSQSGRFAKAFLNLGFNEDLRGRIVWDGLNARIAGMMGSFNTRFAQPGEIAELYLPGAEGPLWWSDYQDKVRGLSAWGLLHRCTASKTCPKITETYGGPEMWYSHGTVGIAGPTGKEDLPLPDNVRRYYHAGTPHGGGGGGFVLGARSADSSSLANNPNPERDIDRALYVALVDWVVKGTPPPPSVYPRVSDGTLVPATAAAMGWPNIPNAPRPDAVINPVLDYDFGPGYRYNDSSGVMTKVPPSIKRVIPTLVGKVNADGNEVTGLKSVLLQVPLGTYTGWNPIASGVLKGRERSLAGGYIPFAKTKAERLASGDPRLSIEERYPTLEAYYTAAAAAAADLVRQRLLLPDDADRLLKQVRTDLESSKLLPGTAAPAQTSPLANIGPNKTITANDCAAARLGTSIPASAIGEPVRAVTLGAPRWIEATATAPARCEVDGVIAPVDTGATARPINFRVWLPAEWNHRAVQQGGGGMNGTIPDLTGARYGIGGRSHAQLGFVTYGSDSGHQAGGRGAGAGGTATQDWALNDEAMKNLGYMQLKKTHDAAMMLIERLYGERPRYSYFTGTSQGGREALTVAQRYPADYDGVIANVPIVNFSSLMLAPELIRIQEKPRANWVTRAKVNAIRGEFMRQCDGLDGLVDGVINNYLACRAIFDVTQGTPGRHPWAAKRCPDNVDPSPADTTAAACLTDGQIATLEFVYRRYPFATPLANGVKAFGMWVPNTDPSGSGLIADTRYRGQEGAADEAPLHSHLGILGVTGFLLRDLAANPLDYREGGPLNARREEISRSLDSTNPDLGPFAARGGKMIVTIGTNDTLASPGAQLDYYQSLLDTMGRAAVDSFARLFVIPQATHGLTGTVYGVDGAGQTIPTPAIANDYERFGYLVGWVERGVAPGKSLVVTAGERSMPLCSYPQFPKYVSGPPAAAASYSCAP